MPSAPYGTWKSPITAEAIVAGGIGLSQPQVAVATPAASAGGAAQPPDIYWLEGRPTEGGRNVIVHRHPDGRTEDVIPTPYNARNRVHEYGGGDYLVDNATVYFANFADQHVYVVHPGAQPRQLTNSVRPEAPNPGSPSTRTPGLSTVEGSQTAPRREVSSPMPRGTVQTPETPENDPLSLKGRAEGSSHAATTTAERGEVAPALMPRGSARGPVQRRYADFALDRPRNRLICVRETHYDTSDDAHAEPTNDIAAVDLTTGAETTLAHGHDFYAYPRLSPDGAHLAWIAWDHPNMPWDATSLYVATITGDGSLTTPLALAGGPTESVLQPGWSPEGRLHYLSDRTGFWNLYRLENLPHTSSVAAQFSTSANPSSSGEHDPPEAAPHIGPLSPRRERGQGGEVNPPMPRGSARGAVQPTATPLAPRPHDFAQPLWQLGITTYAFEKPEVASDIGPPSPLRERGSGGEVSPMVTLYSLEGLWRLAIIDPTTNTLKDLDTPITSARDLTVANGTAYLIAGFPDRPAALIAIDLHTGEIETIKPTTTLALDPAYVSIAQPIEFPAGAAPGAASSNLGGLTAHAFYYPPHNRDYESPDDQLPNNASPSPRTPALSAVEGESAPGAEVSLPMARGSSRGALQLPETPNPVAPNPVAEASQPRPYAQPTPETPNTPELPPLLVMSHGGPTGAAAPSLSPRIQYWTSRGIAVLDVNYGGSTGYGRDYRQRLNRAWGIVDVADCVNGALYLARQGLVDPDRLAITGGSAGGYTTLCALTFYDVFKAGASHYGIGDLEALATDTHKFESRYLDNLIGPYPEARDTYVKRSPIHHTDQLNCPVIFFQGLEDQVVPPNQAEAMVAALRAKRVPVAYFPFEGEQHGFRRAENIKRSLEAEQAFYGRIFGFEPGDEIEPFEIANL